MALFLSDWLKKLILLVLLAAITDLLLPNSNMQRYARLAIGLLIILTLLSPILAIFKLENLGQTISINSYLLSQDNKNEQDFSDIERKANDLKKLNQQEIMDQFTQNFQNEIAFEIERRYETKADVKVQLYVNKQSEAKIDKILVYLLGRVHKKDNKDNPYQRQESIPAIPAIEIKIGEENSNDTDADPDHYEAMSQTSRDIQVFLTSNYQLSEKQVEIHLATRGK